MLKLIKIFNFQYFRIFGIFRKNRDPGLIEIDERTGEVTVAIESNYDKELGAPYYANKARGAVKRMWDSGELPSEKSFTWW